ncbi:MBL fold metallo-hydrolase [Methylotuvimicrobium alcaliphilum]|uniref:Beta-lactamase-like protein n=1 Tax=Methylotuvimicrobium alcaliphilum (strain DSM 19304 / NCIMB 14124 / VKM B-2133 / 20Z) TaxID=1091494 RepID=G4SXN3_META2|nr:MBL fold metallo-hydrolase [Methylotuvimicrobium alcaliphilum]CCE22088.1 Beta-lactamase-like protein [Methylotuvimicrobium alcaliphilum 20Z]
MQLKFRGVRGSIPTPGPNTVKYGGNTTCIEIRTDSGELIILDAGTGIYSLSQQLDKGKPVDAHIFITHTHWDHIQGLPFFTPAFMRGNQITIYGGLDPVTQQSIQRALAVQLQYSFFPIREAELKATVRYVTLTPGKSVMVGDARITPLLLNHPVLNFGYRIECDDRSVFFTGDYEPLFNIYRPEDQEYEPFQSMVDERFVEVCAFLHGVDALIVDASYTEEEYVFKRGWGHGTYQSGLNLAVRSDAKRLFFTHHEPNRTDMDLDNIYRQLLEQYQNLDIELNMAREGIEYNI